MEFNNSKISLEVDDLQLFQKISFIITRIIRNTSLKSNGSVLDKLKNSITSSLFSFPQKKITNISILLEKINYYTNSPSTLYLAALCILQKFESIKGNSLISPKTIQGLFFACFTLAFKYLEDEVYSAKDFAFIGDVDISQYVRAETYIVEALKFDIRVKPEEIELMQQQLDQVWASRLTPQTRKHLQSLTCVTDLFQQQEQPQQEQPQQEQPQQVSRSFSKIKMRKLLSDNLLSRKRQENSKNISILSQTTRSDSPTPRVVNLGNVILVL